jgi:tyrosyl-tRNA synthetase
VGDADVLKCIRMLTFLPLEQIDEMDTWEGSQLNRAKEILAFELTKLVHGEGEARKAEETAKGLFGGSGSAEHIPATELSADLFVNGRIGAMTLLVACGLCASNSEARRLIQQGGVTVSDRKIESLDAAFDREDFRGEGVVIRKGKKGYHRAQTRD